MVRNVLRLSDKAGFSRPGDLFGQFSLDQHLGRSHPDRVHLYHGTHDRSVHPNGLSLPHNSVGLPDLPTGIMNVTAKAGDILVRLRLAFNQMDCAAIPAGYTQSWLYFTPEDSQNTCMHTVDKIKDLAH